MELTIGSLIKMIVGILVVVAVVSGIALFAGNITDFFRNLPGGNSTNLILTLI